MTRPLFKCAVALVCLIWLHSSYSWHDPDVIDSNGVFSHSSTALIQKTSSDGERLYYLSKDRQVLNSYSIGELTTEVVVNLTSTDFKVSSFYLSNNNDYLVFGTSLGIEPNRVSLNSVNLMTGVATVLTQATVLSQQYQITNDSTRVVYGATSVGNNGATHILINSVPIDGGAPVSLIGTQEVAGRTFGAERYIDLSGFKTNTPNSENTLFLLSHDDRYFYYQAIERQANDSPIGYQNISYIIYRAPTDNQAAATIVRRQDYQGSFLSFVKPLLSDDGSTLISYLGRYTITNGLAFPSPVKVSGIVVSEADGSDPKPVNIDIELGAIFDPVFSKSGKRMTFITSDIFPNFIIPTNTPSYTAIERLASIDLVSGQLTFVFGEFGPRVSSSEFSVTNRVTSLAVSAEEEYIFWAARSDIYCFDIESDLSAEEQCFNLEGLSGGFIREILVNGQNKLLFSLDQRGNTLLYGMEFRGPTSLSFRRSSPVRLSTPLDTFGRVSGFTFSSDGSQAIYQANPNHVTNQELFVVPFRGGVSKRISHTLSEGTIGYRASLSTLPVDDHVYFGANFLDPKIGELYRVARPDIVVTELCIPIIESLKESVAIICL